MSYDKNNPLIIGLTGSFGSGCTYIAENILSSHYESGSLSGIVKDLYEQIVGRKHECRNDLQEFGDQQRNEKGKDFFANEVIALINKSDKNEWVVDSIRNPAEIQAFRNRSRNFYLIGVYAEKETRWQRIKEKNEYKGDRNRFDKDDEKDTGKDSPAYGQRVSDCYYEADIVLRNEEEVIALGNKEFNNFAAKVMHFVELMKAPLTNKQVTGNDEAIMAMAYAASQRSSCLQRKVGAIITDGKGNVISSGFNEVPPGENPCLDEHTECYRAVQRNNFLKCLQDIIPDFVEKYAPKVNEQFKGRFRVLDLCRALHAEENAILNLARHGRAAIAEECTLYTTTYPCRMCANKIAQLGIKRVVYLEPYPDDEAKAILEANEVKTEFFEGIAFRAYFRVYGDKR